ncbi:hypothetical protein HMPREF3038_00453 [Akkermansia sp. KLE1797]|nr:hypothetical protein HMPREF3038_00453 [Akkermansia sp. KLE1797]KXU55630.1 hypothetical protein HMPREF3039_00187 [Akkermansia sp. KLE1798]KZA05440.1 hypothetical protein HMPREF1326_00847 [Akkermansia sp. KLE1605]
MRPSGRERFHGFYWNKDFFTRDTSISHMFFFMVVDGLKSSDHAIINETACSRV